VLLVICAAASVVFLIASYHDIRHRSIPNWLPVAVAAAGFFKWLVLAQLAPALWALTAGAVVLMLSALLFSQGWIGGGDVKLAAAAVFLLGAPATLEFLLLMALFGGVLALFLLMTRGRAGQRATIPYGVAIAGSAIAIMAMDWRDLWRA
jgi:prepilin peptidase CpaA